MPPLPCRPNFYNVQIVGEILICFVWKLTKEKVLWPLTLRKVFLSSWKGQKCVRQYLSSKYKNTTMYVLEQEQLKRFINFAIQKIYLSQLIQAKLVYIYFLNALTLNNLNELILERQNLLELRVNPNLHDHEATGTTWDLPTWTIAKPIDEILTRKQRIRIDVDTM